MPSIEANEQRLAEMTNDEVLALIQQLTAYTVNLIKARSWRNSDSQILPKGEDALSLVNYSIEKLLSGAKWDDDKPIWLILHGIIKGRIQTLVNSPENKWVVDHDEEAFDKALEGSVKYGETPPPDPASVIEESESEALLFGIIEELEQSGRIEEKKIVEVIFGGCEKPAEIRAESGLGKDQYEAAKKRLRRYLDKFRQKTSESHH